MTFGEGSRMPKFSVILVAEAVKKAERSVMPDALAEYAEYLGNLHAGEAGRLTPSANRA